MNIPPCLLLILATFPMSTVAECTMSRDEFSCKGTDSKQFWLEFYRSSCEIEGSIIDRSIIINIQDSYFNVIEYFPNLPTNTNSLSLTELTVKNSSVEHVDERALQELHYLEKLDLSYNRIKKVSFVAFLPTSLKHLYLNSNKIAYVDKFFRALPNLVVLDLSNNKIRVLDFSSLGSMITRLRFSNNSIDTLIPTTSANRIKQIDLSYNKIKFFNETNLNMELYYLDISHNELSSVEIKFDKAILNLSRNNNLTKLSTKYGLVNINKLYLSSFHPIVANNSRITILSQLRMTNDKMVVLSNSMLTIFSYFETTKLDLSNSSIESISAYCFDSIHVDSVNLSWNTIEVLKNRAFSNAIISILDLSYSNISKIEKYAFENLKCSTIILRGNKLSNINYMFIQVRVSTLDLSLNPVTHISNNSFLGSHLLDTLNFSNCAVQRIESQAFSGLKYLRTIDLSYNKLYLVESKTFSNLPVENLIFNGAKIDTVQGRAFDNMQNLKEINLYQVGLRSLESYSFHNLSNIKVVDLRNNYISIIPYNLFVGMYNLKEVYLDGNNITIMNSFSNRLKIELLSFSFNGIFKFNEVLNLHLKHLELKNSEIHRLKANSFFGLYNLLRLNFESSNIGFVEVGALSELFNLKFLDSQNLLKHTKVIKQNMFMGLKSLQLLNMSHLSLEELETKAFNGLKRLNTLLLNNNNITHLVEDTFYGIKSLELLNLSCNHIRTLSGKVFRGLDSLNILDLHSNNLLDIDLKISLENLNNLIRLHLDSNNITFIDKESFKDLNKLEHLLLQNNNIHNFSIGVFKHLTSLQFMNISNNNIQLLKTGSFSNLRNLIALDLSNNQLINLDNIDIFFSLKHLEQLMLDGNHLKQFDIRRFLINVRNVKFIGISRNKWKCETLSHIIEAMNNKSIEYTPDIPVYDDDNIDGVGCVDICKYVYCSHQNAQETLHYR